MKKNITSRLMAAMFVLSCAVVLGALLYSRSLVAFMMPEMESNIRARLRETSLRCADMVTADDLAAYQKPEDMDMPGYHALRRKLLDFAAAAGVLYVYYLRSAGDGQFQYIADNDFNEMTRVGLDTPPSDVALEPSMGDALAGRASVAELGSYMSEQWGGLLSAYAPIFDAEGRVTAVCGVDIDDEMIVNARRSIKK